MSVTHDIACMDCRESFWIGQGNYIYTGDPKCMEGLRQFLFKHMGHHLVFGPDDDLLLTKEFVPAPEKEEVRPAITSAKQAQAGCPASPSAGEAPQIKTGQFNLHPIQKEILDRPIDERDLIIGGGFNPVKSKLGLF